MDNEPGKESASEDQLRKRLREIQDQIGLARNELIGGSTASYSSKKLQNLRREEALILEKLEKFNS